MSECIWVDEWIGERACDWESEYVHKDRSWLNGAVSSYVYARLVSELVGSWLDE